MKDEKNIEPRLLTIKQASQFLNIHPGTIYNGVAPNSLNPFPIKPVRLGRKVLFRKIDLEQYVNSL
jgi:excisionase family DNA binding protein